MAHEKAYTNPPPSASPAHIAGIKTEIVECWKELNNPQDFTEALMAALDEIIPQMRGGDAWVFLGDLEAEVGLRGEAVRRICLDALGAKAAA